MSSDTTTTGGALQLTEVRRGRHQVKRERKRCPWCKKWYSGTYLPLHKRKFCSHKVDETNKIHAENTNTDQESKPPTASVFESHWNRRKRKTFQLKVSGPWYHKCEKCLRSFRCVPSRPTGVTIERTIDTPCRCIEWCRRKSFFCGNQCFWDAMSAASGEPEVWCL